MKKYLILSLFIWINLSVPAQDVVKSFLEMHAKDDNLEIVSIGKKMLKMVCTLSSDDPNLTNAIKDLETIRIVSSKDQDSIKEYYTCAQDLVAKAKGFEGFFSMSKEDKELMVMIRESKGNIKELLLLSEQPEEGFNLISISGKINLDDLLQYSGKIE